LLLPLIGTRYRDAFAMVAPLLALAHIWMLPTGALVQTELLGYGFTFLQVGDYTRIFATAFSLAALGGTLFAIGYGRHKEIASAMVYAGAAIAVTYAGDLITLLVFWEVMAIASTFVLWASNLPEARASGMRYAAMHFLGGLLLMTGVSLWVMQQGHGDIQALTDHLANWSGFNLAVVLILLGLLVNVAAPPFSAWLADSYPLASPSGTVYLSAMTTKTAVYALLVLFPGLDLLLPIGMFMVFYGIIFAMLENNIRRILSYSIINQAGFMVTAIGIGTPLALLGAAAHAFCHIIYKALLMMSAGAVIQMTDKHKCTELGGLYHSMKLTTICGTIGALAISAFPMTSGFISKSMIASASANQHMFWIWLGLLAASAGVFLHAGIKFPWFVFFQRDSGLRPKDPPLAMRIGMIAFSGLCILPGAWPEFVYQMLPTIPDYEPNTLAHWVTQLQLLLFSGLAFFMLLPYLQRTKTVSLDFDWLYRVLLLKVLRYAEWVWETLVNGAWFLSHRFFSIIERRVFYNHQPAGLFARSTVTGVIVIWLGILLGAYLLTNFTIL